MTVISNPPRRKTYTERIAFIFAKGLAQQALREEAERDPENRWVQEMTKRLAAVRTQAELDELLEAHGEDDWLELYICERSVEIVATILQGGDTP